MLEMCFAVLGNFVLSFMTSGPLYKQGLWFYFLSCEDGKYKRTVHILGLGELKVA